MSIEGMEMVRIPVVQEKIPVPPAVKAELKDSVLTVRGSKGVVSKKFFHPRLRMSLSSGEVTVEARNASRREKALVGTWAAHVHNMIRGVEKPFIYTMKAVYAHFPIKLTVKEGEVVIENFLGERHPRRAKIIGDTKVTVKGQELVLEGPSIEDVGQTAANIEQATYIKNRDPRVFQDGIYITRKGED
ncbi:MAG: 50S ribosomal protein L6 [Thermoplasmata archaeon]